jgi:LPS O-antigen subunit length determinant protein (WzzB/FepE family)
MNLETLQCIARINTLVSYIADSWSDEEISSYLNADILQAFVTELATAEALRASAFIELENTARENAKKAALVKIEELMRSAQEIATAAGVPFVVPTTEKAEEFEESDSWSNSNCY